MELIGEFVAAARGAATGALCHQMLMGGGKTTCVAPLVAMMLADGHSLVVSVVPTPLLDFTRAILKSKYVSALWRPVVTLRVNRYTRVDEWLAEKLERAVQARSALFLLDLFAAVLCRLCFAVLLRFVSPPSFPACRRQQRRQN